MHFAQFYQANITYDFTFVSKNINVQSEIRVYGGWEQLLKLINVPCMLIWNPRVNMYVKNYQSQETFYIPYSSELLLLVVFEEFANNFCCKFEFKPFLKKKCL